MSDYYKNDTLPYYEDDFSGYIPSSARPDYWLAVVAIAYSFSSVLLLPLKVMYDKRNAKYDTFEKEGTVKEESNASSLEKMDDNSADKETDAELNVKKKPEYQAQSRILEIIRCDKDSKRIVSLALPFTTSAVFTELFDALTLVVIGYYLGSISLTAYVCVDLFLGLTDSAIHGVTDAASTLCAHAIGSENYVLAGHFMQLTTIMYLSIGVPFLIMWYFIIEDVMQLMGLDQNIVALAVGYTRIVAYHFIVDGLHSWAVILDVNGQEVFTSTMHVLESGISFVLVLICCATADFYSLYWVGVTKLLVGIFFAIIWVVFPLYKGWLSPFLKGFIQSNGFKHDSAVTQLVKTSIPLALNELLEYGEWGLLVFFALYIGHAEVAAWGIIGSIWDLLISSVAGLSESANIRVASYLGKGDSRKAELSAFKALFMSLILSSANALLICSLINVLPNWLTKDETLSEMIEEVIPFIAVAALPLGFATVLWEIIGAQGRYKVTTLVYFSCFVGIILPAAATFTFHFNFNLLGLVIAILFGWSTIVLVLSYVLYTSDWNKIAFDIAASYTDSEEDDSSDSDSESPTDNGYSSDSDSKSSDEDEGLHEIELV